MLLPFELPGQLPYELPGQLPYELPGQLPYDLPGQLPYDLPGQLPYELPGQLPYELRLDNSTYSSDTVMLEWDQPLPVSIQLKYGKEQSRTTKAEVLHIEASQQICMDVPDYTP